MIFRVPLALNSKTDSPVTLPLEHFKLYELFLLSNVLNCLVEKEVNSDLFQCGVRFFSNILCSAKSDGHWQAFVPCC